MYRDFFICNCKYPLGTGKTLTGAYLVHAMYCINNTVYHNEADTKTKQILYCGPSNSAVDVAACKYFYQNSMM